jgi:thioredoxin-dependent peroxiredoxin
LGKLAASALVPTHHSVIAQPRRAQRYPHEGSGSDSPEWAFPAADLHDNIILALRCAAATGQSYLSRRLSEGLALPFAAPYISPAKAANPENPPTEDFRMALQIGDTAPDFEADTTEGKIHFHDWIGSHWVVLFSHPKDFTPVCTTELGTMARLKPEFDKRGVKIVGLSVDPVDNHKKWSADIKDVVGFAPNYPMIGDTDLKIAKLYGMLPASTAGTSEGRTPADNQTVRNVFVIGPDKKIKLILVYPMTTGRNFDEVLRVVDSMQLTAKHRVATPANWKQGEDVILTGAVTDEEAKKLYPAGWKTLKPYIRVVPQPK